jgi:hypothetical protein
MTFAIFAPASSGAAQAGYETLPDTAHVGYVWLGIVPLHICRWPDCYRMVGYLFGIFKGSFRLPRSHLNMLFVPYGHS